MQNVLLLLPYQVTTKDIAEALAVLFEKEEYSNEFPDSATLIRDNDHVFLHQYHDVKEKYDQWFDESQYELAMSMETFIELQFKKLQTAKKVLSVLAEKYAQLVIQFDDFSLTSSKFADKVKGEPEWDWR